MMQSGEKRSCSYPPYPLNWPAPRRVFDQRKMGAVVIIVGGIIGKNLSEMPIVAHDHMIQAFAPD